MNRNRQQGVALISVLLIMALALLVVGSLMRSHTLMLQSSSQQIHQVQLRQWAISAESWARVLLSSPSMEPAGTVNLAQEWARAPGTFEVPGVEVHLSIEDLAGRFNLTRLLGAGKADEISLQRWSRLLQSLALAPIDLAPLRGTDVSDISQLRLLPGVGADTLERLDTWVALLPAEALLNVNTASATLLATLEGMSAASAQSHISQRPPQGFADAQAFARSPGLDGLGIASQGLGVDSRWFRITVEVGVGSNRLRLVSDVERLSNPHRLRVLQRRFMAPTESESS